MITGDNALTAAAIAAEAGVDDFMAQATPEAKLKRIRDEQSKGHLVAMLSIIKSKSAGIFPPRESTNSFTESPAPFRMDTIDLSLF